MTDSTKKTAEERLQELLDLKDAEIERLGGENRELERLVEADPFAWALGGEVPDRGLPVPRLEIEWTPDPEWGWQKSVAVYRLVYPHLTGKTMSIGLGRTVQNSNRADPPINPMTFDRRPGCVELPWRDGAHICHDMAALRLPGYAICGDRIDDLAGLSGKPHER